MVKPERLVDLNAIVTYPEIQLDRRPMMRVLQLLNGSYSPLVDQQIEMHSGFILFAREYE